VTEDEQNARIAQLQTQQSLFTRGLIAALEGRWQGPDSVEAYLYALDPALEGQLSPNPPSYL
jgi:hypothetical protein